MADTWERRNIPYGPGYNNPGSAFTVTYDSLLDRLVIQASQPVLGTLDTAQGAGEQPNGTPGWTFGILSGDLVIDSPTQAHLPNAWTYLINTPGEDGEVQQLDLYTAGLTLIGTWTGSALVTEPAVPALIDVTNSYSTVWNSTAVVDGGWTCGNAATAVPEAGFFFYTDPGFVTTYGGNGVRVEGTTIGGGAFIQDYVYDS
jgi:hypothetical protein